ncbi:MAG: aldo/keto reductase, partial [Hyphomicrobiaceae bacterium]
MGFGGAPLGGFRGKISEQQASRTIRAALDGGQRYFDTAPFYGYGRSELRLGHVLRDLPRGSFVLSTKVGRVLEPYDRTNPPEGMRVGGLAFAARFDYSAAGAERSMEQSMMRLGIPEIDIVYIHDVDVFTHGSRDVAEHRFEEAMAGCYPYLQALRKDGMVKAIGVGLNETEMSLRFARQTDIDCILLAGRYTLLDQSALAGLLPHCEKKDIAVVLGGPFNSGVL